MAGHTAVKPGIGLPSILFHRRQSSNREAATSNTRSTIGELRRTEAEAGPGQLTDPKRVAREPAGRTLRLIFPRQLQEELHCQRFRRHRAELGTLAALSRGNNQDLPRDPVITLEYFPVDLAGDGVALLVTDHNASSFGNRNR